MKRYFVETNGYNMVAFVGTDGKAYAFHEETFDKELTLETAKNSDYSGIEDAETAEEIAQCIGTDKALENIFDWADVEAEEITEF